MLGTCDGRVDYESHTNHKGARASITHLAALAGGAGPTVEGSKTTVGIVDCPDCDMQLWTGEGGDHAYLLLQSTTTAISCPYEWSLPEASYRHLGRMRGADSA